ncbi:M42 family metallopeptidase [Carboxydochorda subterranea]|uniref:M42 family metallopeptidase n=1 Tax=Carboxydichorda subterranea TaxID=3109565 RepID=A0ABZ1BX89_9FIRM|nr:M42 family metallopeptidase [Limnochorda sp. L945t]WRP17286.1 M42 family metallopeptidase [Limnochorda sp. L945t]
MQLQALLRDMAMIPALSGHEERMARYLRDAIAAYADEVQGDPAGNVVATFRGTDPRAPRVMVFAHMDQLGFVVRRIEDDGFLRVERLGGIPEKILPGTPVLVETEDGDTVPGVFGNKSHHATPPEEKYTVTPYRELYVDVGATSAAEVRALGVEIGCPVVYEPRFQVLQGGRVSGTSLDDRGGCAVLVGLAERVSRSRSAATLHLVGSVQEEFNLRGAMLAAAALQPQVAISVDVMLAGDTPDMKGHSDLRLGGGPVLGMYNFHGRGTLNGTIPHPLLARLIREAAGRLGMPLQRSATVGILTDGSYVQLVGTGIPSVDLGFPVRYTHTPVETCQLSDLEQLITLLEETIRSLGPDLDWARGLPGAGQAGAAGTGRAPGGG